LQPLLLPLLGKGGHAMSLRAFHLIFILLAVLGADFFGAWTVYEWRQTGNTPILLFGAISFLGGLGLAAYSGWFVHKMEQAHLQ
jgi:hypothetical protein